MDKYIEGLFEGEAKGIKKIAINMLKANKQLDEISLFARISEDTIAKFKSEL